MTPRPTHPDLTAGHASHAERLRSSGILIAHCDANGRGMTSMSRHDDWLADLLLQNPIVLRGAQEAAAAWADSDQPEVISPVPGLHLAPFPIRHRRRCIGFDLAILLSTEMLDAERLNALCDAAEVSIDDVAGQLADLPPVAPEDVSRFVDLLRLCYDSRQVIAAERQAAESVGKQLAESYEEISLLYTITQSMTDVQQPDRFLTIACEELLGTLPYTWVGALFRQDLPWLKRLAGHQVIVGNAPADADTVQRVVARLLDGALPDGPIIIENSGPHADPEFAMLGRAVLAQPVVRDRQVIGLLVAGERHGDDGSISSVDIKLLGATATHLAIFLENAALYDDLNTMFLGTLEALTASIDAKDRYTCGHSLRVAHLTEQLALAAGIDPAAAGRMRVAGLVHDVGKIGVPEAVLTKPGRLTDDEFEWIRRHPEMGYRILKDIPQLVDILPGVLHHHERWDGTGYPSGLANTDIPLVARIITLADSFDAMSSTRTYRAAMLRADVLREIERTAGKQFDPDLAPLFVKLDFTRFDELVDEHRASSQFDEQDAA